MATAVKESLRLERGEGANRTFWEITRMRTTVTTRFGRHLSAGRTVTRDYDTMAAATGAYGRAVEEKRRAGYADPPVRAVVGGASRKGMSARNFDIEALIEADPSEADRYLVYADWLQQQGDPRGELIAIQHRLAISTDERELGTLERDEATLFKKYEAELLGPLAPYAIIRDSMRSYRTFSWRHGFIRTARLSRRWDQRILTDLFTHPSGRFLERLVCPAMLDDSFDGFGTYDMLRTLAPPALCSMIVGDAGYDRIAIAPLWASLPRLRFLTLDDEIADLGEPPAPSLEALHAAHVNATALEQVAKGSWPKLRRLHLTLLAPESTSLIAEALDPARMPTLDHVSVRFWLVDGRGPIAQDALALFLLRFFANRVRRLDLEMPISTQAARSLMIGDSLQAIPSLTLPPALIDRDTRAALAKANPTIAWTDPAAEQALELPAIDAS